MLSDIPQTVKDQADLTKAGVDEWLKEDVLHLSWYILIGLIVLAFVAWLLLLDKSRLKETILFAALFMIIVLGIDEYGDELILWDYPVDVMPIFRTLTAFNLLLLPMAYSLVYQYSGTTRRFVFAALAATAVVCFAVEPLLSLGNMYQLLNWHYWWSFPFYFTAALIVRRITHKAFKIKERNAEKRR